MDDAYTRFQEMATRLGFTPEQQKLRYDVRDQHEEFLRAYRQSILFAAERGGWFYFRDKGRPR